jgi:hypothetical protein
MAVLDATTVLNSGPDLVRALYKEFGTFCSGRGRVSEADTRANVLDRLLHEILLWPRESVHRETHVQPGFLDYELRVGRPVIVVEAKAAGSAFTVPFTKASGSRRLRLSGSLTTNKELAAAVLQVQKYCVDQGSRYAVATNGYCFVLFQALTEGRQWKKCDAVIFRGPKDIEDDFTTFWNLLSFEAVSNGRLDHHFRGADATPREHFRPIEKLVEADATYGRNPLSAALNPYVEKFFGDIGSLRELDILTHCYVHSRPTQVIDKQLTLVISDHIPGFAAHAEQVETSDAAPAGSVGEHIRALLDHPKQGSVVVLMGGIGSGKSTFLKRFFKVVAPELVAPGGPAAPIYLDFLGSPENPLELEAHLWREVAAKLVEEEPRLLTRAVLEEIFSTKLVLLRELYRDDQTVRDAKIASVLYDAANDVAEFSRASLKWLASGHRLPLVVFDNVDQLPGEAQARIFGTAQSFALHLNCLCILVLREESYCTAQMQKQLTAYTIRPYHLSSPMFRKVVKVRLEFAANDAARGAGKSDLLDFFRVLHQSVFERNYNIIRLVESISFGNMRLALGLFSNFLTSGATNLAKILAIFRSTGGYLVPFHEFIKSVMLGEFRYYKESRSFLMNVFHVTPARNSSHFTTLRVLRYLSGTYDTSKSGEEFVGLDSLLNSVGGVFDNEDDCLKSILWMMQLNRQLVELDTRRTDSLAGAAEVRITACGRYYMEYLVKSFAYLDLVWQDTAIRSRTVSGALQKTFHQTDVEQRFARVDEFLDYLNEEETVELSSRGLVTESEGFYGPFIPGVRAQFEAEKQVVRRKMSRSDLS